MSNDLAHRMQMKTYRCPHAVKQGIRAFLTCVDRHGVASRSPTAEHGTELSCTHNLRRRCVKTLAEYVSKHMSICALTLFRSYFELLDGDYTHRRSWDWFREYSEGCGENATGLRKGCQ